VSFSQRPCGKEVCVEPRNTDLAGVRYILGGQDLRLPLNRFDLIYDREMRVYQDRETIGRAFFVDSYEVVPNVEAAIARTKSATFNPRATVVLDRTPALVPGASGGPSRVTVLEHTPLSVTIQADSSTSRLLVLSDTYYPGWEADIDDKPAPILRANGVMRAVALAPGSHTVRFAYRPGSLKRGAAISLLSLVSALAIVAFAGTAKTR
jgi:hypothetical protein